MKTRIPAMLAGVIAASSALADEPPMSPMDQIENAFGGMIAVMLYVPDHCRLYRLDQAELDHAIHSTGFDPAHMPPSLTAAGVTIAKWYSTKNPERVCEVLHTLYGPQVTGSGSHVVIGR